MTELDMATMYDVPLYSIDDTYEIVGVDEGNDEDDEDDYPFLGERHEHIVDNWLVVDSEDYIIDIGPEGGAKGGRIVAQGTPEKVCEVEESYTGKYLKPYLE